MTPVALAEELLLLAYDDLTGKDTGSRIALDLGMAAAILVELAFAGRIALDGAMVVVRDPAPTGDPIADAALTRIAAESPNTIAAWLQRLRHNLRDRVLAQLCARGVVRDIDELALEHIPLHRYPATDASVEDEVRDRLAAALDGTAEPDRRTATLAGLLAAARMEPALRRTNESAGVTRGKLRDIADRAGFTGTATWPFDFAVPREVAVIVAALTRAIETALGRIAK